VDDSSIKQSAPFPSVKQMPVEVVVSRITVDELSARQAVFLKEVNGGRLLPISIGIFEATSIGRFARGDFLSRPLTHELIATTVEILGGELQDVLITELSNRTFYCVLRIRCEGALLEVDARPSDAIAIAMTFRPALPIYAMESVLESANPSDSD